jgi:hypothetical protein
LNDAWTHLHDPDATITKMKLQSRKAYASAIGVGTPRGLQGRLGRQFFSTPEPISIAGCGLACIGAETTV